MGYDIPEEDAKKPYIEVSGRKGQGVKADDLIDQLEASARKEVDEGATGYASEAEGARDSPRRGYRCAPLFFAAVHALDSNCISISRTR